MDVADKYVKLGAPHVRESLLDIRGTIHPQALGGEAFLKKHPDTLFIVKHQHGAAPENINRCENGFC